MRDRRLVAALVLAAATAAAPQLAAQSREDRRAAELMEQGDWVRAVETLRPLVDQKPTATRLFNLAQAERNLGRLVEAKSHFTSALAAAKREGLDDVASAARDAARGLEKRIAHIEVVLPENIAGIVVRLEGRQVELGADRSLEVDPGARRLHVSAPGHEAFERELSVREGQRQRIDVVLEPSGHAPPSPGAPLAPSRGEPSALPPVPVLVLGGVGLAALAGGVAFHFVSDSKYDDAASACRDDGDRYVCPEGLENDARHQELIDDAESAGTLRNVLFAVGAGALVAGGIWWALSPSSPSSPELGVSVAPGLAAARVRVPIF
jgi:hypothetical protein